MMRVNPYLWGISVLASATLMTVGGPAVAQGSDPDKIVLATVNGESITRQQLVARLLEYRRDETLERLIGRKLVFDAAKKANLQVSEGDLQARLTQIRARFKSEEAFKEFLRQSGLTEDQHRQELAATMLAERVATRDHLITEDELKLYDVRMIVAADRAAADKLAAELTPANFNNIASQRNEDGALRTAAGRMKPFVKIELPEVVEALEKQGLKPEGVTKAPIKLGNGKWVLLKLDRLIPAATVSASERERIQTLVTRFYMGQWMEKAQAAAKIERNSADPKVVATVNGEPVTRAQLIAQLIEFQGEEELDRMINRTLLLQAARKVNVTVTDDEAERKMAEIRKQFPTQEHLQAFLTRNSLTERRMRDETRYGMLMERVALKETPITDEDLLRYDVRVLSAPDKKTAEEWVKELDNGADFVKMVTERSEDPDGRQSGGRVRPFLKIELLDVWRVIQEQSLRPGGYSRKPALLTDNSWVILKLENLLPAAQAPPQVKERLRASVTAYRVNQWLGQTVNAAKQGGQISRPTAIGPAVIAAGAG
jgi:foldase protein PrsA